MTSERRCVSSGERHELNLGSGFIRQNQNLGTCLPWSQDLTLRHFWQWLHCSQMDSSSVRALGGSGVT